jgi:hypothetical protein
LVFLEGGIVNPVPWRQHLTYAAMSLVVAWHSIAMMVSPAPNGSEIVASMRQFFHPYLALFRLETPWNFFAPVGKHAEFRYVVEDDAGQGHTFVPSEETAQSLSRYVWWREFKYFNDAIMASPEFRADAAGTVLCQRHAALKPVSVTILEVVEQNYRPTDELLGKHPLDPEFAVVVPERRVACPRDAVHSGAPGQ